MPLLTGPVAGAKLGLVVTFRLDFEAEPWVPEVFDVLVEAVLAEEEVDELLEEPQPATVSSAAQAASAVRRGRVNGLLGRLLICELTLA